MIADVRPFTAGVRPPRLAKKLLVKETLEGPELEAAFSEPLSDADKMS